MRSLRTRLSALLLAVVVEFVLLLAPINASAQAFTFAANNAATPALNNIIKGVGRYAAGSVAAQANAAIQTAAGRGASIAVTATTPVGLARLASLAGAAAKAGTAIGIATLVVPWVLQQSGYAVCPPPDFFCKKVQDFDRNLTGWSCSSDQAGYTSTLNACVSSCIAYYNKANGVTDWAAGGQSVATDGKSAITTVQRVNSQHVIVTSNCNASRAVAQVPATVSVGTSGSEMTNSIQSNIATDEAKQKAVYDALVRDGIQVHTIDDPVTVSAPPVTLPEKVVTETVPNPNKPVENATKTTTTTTTVAPQQTGNTMNNAVLRLVETTTTTTVIRDTGGNIISSNTIIENNYATYNPAADPIEIPKDYNKEETQLAIKRELSGEGAPDLADQKAVVKTATDKSDADLDKQRTNVQNEQESDKGKIFSWIWTPPVGTCSPATGNVHGYSISWDICPTVNNIRDALGWLMGVFALASVYGELFRKSDD